MPTFDEVKDSLRSATLRELVILASGGLNGQKFVHVAALRERFLDAAFDDPDLSLDERCLAAAWARTIDSALLLMLEQQPDTKHAYILARDSSQQEKVRFGFGSAAYIAMGGAATVAVSQMHAIHAQLLGIAFGIQGFDAAQA